MTVLLFLFLSASPKQSSIHVLLLLPRLLQISRALTSKPASVHQPSNTIPSLLHSPRLSSSTTSHSTCFISSMRRPYPLPLPSIPPLSPTALLLLYLPTAALGYMQFGSTVQVNILLMVHGPSVTVVEVLMLVNNLFTYVLIMNPLSQSLEEAASLPTREYTLYPVLPLTPSVCTLVPSVPHSPTSCLYLNLLPTRNHVRICMNFD